MRLSLCLHALSALQKHGDPVVERYRQDMGRQPAFDALGQAIVHYEKILELYQQGVSALIDRCLVFLDYFLLYLIISCCIVMSLVGCVTLCWWAEPEMAEPTARQPTGWMSQCHTSHRLNAALAHIHTALHLQQTMQVKGF